MIGCAAVILRDGEVALIDESDVALVAPFDWTRRRSDGYVTASVTGQSTVYMHRLITSAPKGMVVDHANRNKLDNRRANLRVTTQTMNLGNQVSVARNTSGFKGINFSKRRQRWRAKVLFAGRHVEGKTYDNPIDAALAYDQMAVQHFGEFARINFEAPNMSKRVVFTHRWQFVAVDFAGWPDGKPWTRVEPGPVISGTIPETPEGADYTMPALWIERIADHLDDMARTFEMQKNETEAPWHRARTRTAERPHLIRTRIVTDTAPAEACDGVPLAAEPAS